MNIREKIPNGFRWRLIGFASREIKLASIFVRRESGGPGTEDGVMRNRPLS
jgi:hypothetical protein